MFCYLSSCVAILSTDCFLLQWLWGVPQEPPCSLFQGPHFLQEGALHSGGLLHFPQGAALPRPCYRLAPFCTFNLESFLSNHVVWTYSLLHMLSGQHFKWMFSKIDGITWSLWAKRESQFWSKPERGTLRVVQSFAIIKVTPGFT